MNTFIKQDCIKSIKIFSEDNNVKAFTISNKMFFWTQHW